MTAEAAGQVPPGEAGFQLLADELPDVIIVAFDPQLMMWAATGGGLRGHGWTAEDSWAGSCRGSLDRARPRRSRPVPGPPSAGCAPSSR